MSKYTKPPRDPRGHSLRIYSDVYDSPAYTALSPHDVLAYLALLRELKGYNNGDLSLPLTRSKKCGIKHHITLARSLRALCAVGLVAITRHGGCTKGGQRLPTLYRLTDRECHEIPQKFLEAKKETNEWKRITTQQQAKKLIQAAEENVKKVTSEKKALGHRVTKTMSPRVPVSPKTRTPRDTWSSGPGHRVTMVDSTVNPVSMRVAADFSTSVEKPIHRTPHVSPIYLATPKVNLDPLNDQGTYKRLTHLTADQLFRTLRFDLGKTVSGGFNDPLVQKQTYGRWVAPALSIRSASTQGT